ncbi:hypothetical protein SAMN05421678_1163 [Actinopolymorpha cephalotaxi]|uniref:Uncharacterized protein n=1 Tax=Actinopolymorpha cephalotaxi TaxID=504797 RepID=A0A1I2ZBL7_9ACTN|nr:hypothetical protein [Actinopolymorpha cephalotaxi]NYH81890.1 hypothetical protein [Actinopolymorpha cephalotaxi]SFH35080.1 hypothetical protein SAMN05421678_1163 [Actinopolymorpha cephalotaxi]
MSASVAVGSKESGLSSRLRAAWRAAHDPVPGVPRWVRIAAYAVPFTVLPSGLWRVAAVTFHLPIVTDPPRGGHTLGMPDEAYVVVLSAVSELLAFTAVGLVARWGEVFPWWVPGLRGRRVPTAAAVVPAALGATVLTVLWTKVFAGLPASLREPAPPGDPIAEHGWRLVVFVGSYAPLLLWGPLLAAVTVAYWRRRTGRSEEE